MSEGDNKTSSKPQKPFNFNVGVLGHVDSGKTSLAKALSTTASTAAFDKNPQSKERGITLDLGFSSFHLPLENGSEAQITLVDCPGHASLIRTVIGGAQIIDLVLLVVDVQKGFQTQTAECLLLAEITCPKRMLVVLNKTDLATEAEIAKVERKVKITLQRSSFKDVPVVAVSAVNHTGLDSLISALRQQIFEPKRHSNGRFLMAVDHCFIIRGQGTVLTGTVLSGRVKLGDDVSIPALGEMRKVKSMQVFRKPVETAKQGDRLALCVTQLEAKQFERGLVCEKDSVVKIYAAIVSFRKIPYFKQRLANRAKFHISLSHETVMAECQFFSSETSDFSFDHEYSYVDAIETTTDKDDSLESKDRVHFVLLSFDQPVLCPQQSLYIASRLDTDIHSNQCRLAFHGRLLATFQNRQYRQKELSSLKVFKMKCRQGVVERVADETTVIVRNLLKKESNFDAFSGLTVVLSTGEQGRIESSFGQSGKVKVRVMDGLKTDTMTQLQRLAPKKKGKKKISEVEEESESAIEQIAESIKVSLTFKRYIFDQNKKMVQ